MGVSQGLRTAEKNAGFYSYFPFKRIFFNYSLKMQVITFFFESWQIWKYRGFRTFYSFMSDDQGKCYSRRVDPKWKICHHNLLCFAYICRYCSFCSRPWTAAIKLKQKNKKILLSHWQKNKTNIKTVRKPGIVYEHKARSLWGIS